MSLSLPIVDSTPAPLREPSPPDGCARGKYAFVSLGCPKNLVDSERILTQLRTEGYDVVPSYDDAEVVVVNTCGFIDSAVQES
ncbi:MAG: 30S ribosomal protein S12 methylthiotransferase RimO, partial [Planctomycetales bacterium]|nr:30S ribosomal protein S12 methylthiotransferase RimO [Planctomycetales bacterium]